MKTIMLSKQIHSCCASASSNDFWFSTFVKETEIDFELKENEIIVSKNLPFLTGEAIEEITGDNKFMAIYFSSDKTFYNKSLNGRHFFNTEYHKSEEFKALVGSYLLKGWRKEKNNARTLYNEREDKRQEIKARKAGLVLWMSYDNLKKADLSIYKGGFSDEVFNTAQLQDYISNHAAFGWIGDSGARRPEHDKAIELGLRGRGLNAEQMYNWISSGDGRHFADSLCGYPLKEQLAKIKSYLNTIYNLCLVYADAQHEGTLKSINEIWNKLNKENLLLSE